MFLMQDILNYIFKLAEERFKDIFVQMVWRIMNYLGSPYFDVNYDEHCNPTLY